MYSIKRYPPTSQKSLQAWNAADEHLMKYLKEEAIAIDRPILFNDRFGYLTVHLKDYKPQVFLHYASQRKAIEQNLEATQVDIANIKFLKPLDDQAKDSQIILLKIPKSLDLLDMQLAEIASYCDKGAIVLCAFMTKYFSKKILKVAEKYFDSVEQSLAWKKSRVLVLKGAKPINFNSDDFLASITFNEKDYKQYPGVFSSDHIDYATQFLLENLKIEEGEQRVFDLASGNGIIASELLRMRDDIEVHLMDDAYLAVASAKLNLPKEAHFHFNDDLSSIEKESFDLVVSNPPSHFEHENNIDVSLSLFRQVKDILKPSGRFIIVSSKHLNFGKHLEKMYKLTKRIENKKFEVLIVKKLSHI